MSPAMAVVIPAKVTGQSGDEDISRSLVEGGRQYLYKGAISHDKLTIPSVVLIIHGGIQRTAVPLLFLEDEADDT